MFFFIIVHIFVRSDKTNENLTAAGKFKCFNIHEKLSNVLANLLLNLMVNHADLAVK